MLSGCGGDCQPSSNIQVTVYAGPGVDVSKVARLRLILVINDGESKTDAAARPATPFASDALSMALPTLDLR